MKRHPHLQPLSDDHHRALVLARRIGRAAQATPDRDALTALWQDLRERFAGELEPHFRIEEAQLLPELDRAGEQALAERTRTDHARLRALVRSAPDPTAAAQFAELLQQHVRFEERELFPTAERVLPAAALEAVGRAALVEAVRHACVAAAVDGYEQASLSGLCHEGAWEAALGAIRALDLDALLTGRSTRDARPEGG